MVFWQEQDIGGYTVSFSWQAYHFQDITLLIRWLAGVGRHERCHYFVAGAVSGILKGSKILFCEAGV